ncbi:hypothetical protein [Phaeodactylibacter luteus]|uniref:HTTM domain-containing protein n=1 Tax=Phaeodactylibacter luteus TaxID=1564516 RepID=A0A5C6RKD6_9BACT|nr:hypothetical protein [Phaeodactylibacter luteus]TXB62385.1 hypothetical protein FRY97_14595 [Phaeodactylibacter luteus]
MPIASDNIGKRVVANAAVSLSSPFRVFFGLLLIVMAKDYSFLGELPSTLFRPHLFILSNLLDAWPSAAFFKGSFYLKILLGLFVVLGVHTRFALLGVGVVGILQNTFIYSFGKIDHSILFDLLPFVLFFSNLGSQHAVLPDKKWHFEKEAVGAFAFIVVYGFFTAGIGKALVWLDFDLHTSGFLSWFLSGYYSLGRDELLAEWVLKFPPLILEIMDYAAVFFELSGVFFLFWSRKMWFFYLTLICVFHFMNALFLNIGFAIHIPVVGIWLFIPYFEKFKWLVITIPLFFLLDNILFVALSWLLMSILGVISVKNEC